MDPPIAPPAPSSVRGVEKGERSVNASDTLTKPPPSRDLTLLVIDYSHNWYRTFDKRVTSCGRSICVEQAEWKDVHVESSAERGTKVHLKASTHPFPFTTQKEDRVVQPDMVLFRNFPTDIHDNSFRNMVLGLHFSRVPGVNSPHSVLQTMDRAAVYAAMRGIASRLGRDRFPLIPMSFHPNLRASTLSLLPPTHFPAVIKVGSTHAGYGKCVVKSRADLEDVKSILAMHNDYYTIEPFVPHQYEFRVQKIGKHYRAFRRNSDSSWKNNWGDLRFVDHPMEPKYIEWVEECASLFGGLDMLAIDVLHKEDGTDVILEMNDTAFGLMWEHEEEDVQHMADVVMERIEEKC